MHRDEGRRSEEPVADAVLLGNADSGAPNADDVDGGGDPEQAPPGFPGEDSGDLEQQGDHTDQQCEHQQARGEEAPRICPAVSAHQHCPPGTRRKKLARECTKTRAWPIRDPQPGIEPDGLPEPANSQIEFPILAAENVGIVAAHRIESGAAKYPEIRGLRGASDPVPVVGAATQPEWTVVPPGDSTLHRRRACCLHDPAHIGSASLTKYGNRTGGVIGGELRVRIHADHHRMVACSDCTVEPGRDIAFGVIYEHDPIVTSLELRGDFRTAVRGRPKREHNFFFPGVLLRKDRFDGGFEEALLVQHRHHVADGRKRGERIFETHAMILPYSPHYARPMQLATDGKRALHLAKRVLKGRRAYFDLKKMLQERGPLPQAQFRIGVYFADSDVNIYQMRQWYAVLHELSEQWPVVCIARNAAGARTLMEESGLDVAFAPKVTDLETLVAQQPLDIILYVNQNTRNFQMMRYGDRWHVFINHGESDKMYMTSNQYKAYDYAFVAGDAARARLSRALWDYDVTERTLMIGRPQNDHLDGASPFPADDRTVVLYAPTWEGDRPAASYGSVVTHGEALVSALLATGRHRVVYRPHPRSGVVDHQFGAANMRIIEKIAEANRTDPKAQHMYDDAPAIGWQLRVPDIAICDISAMVYDRLATGKPLMVTRPVAPEATVDEDGYLSVCEWLTEADLSSAPAVLDRVIADQAARERLGFWSERYFGDTSPGAPTARLHRAVETLLTRADAWRSRTAAADEGDVVE